MITRATLRADGQTVGEAMDRDAAFLRSLGLDIPDGSPTLDEQREAFQETVRLAVLGAMDEAAQSLGQPHGWTDQDLPAIFPGVDAVADRLFDKHLFS